MSRYADQLPINTAPNSANFVLATNDSDPKALERLPFDLVGGSGGGSTEYTIVDQTALDVDSNYALSAGLYLYVGNAPANFDLSGLVDGERVEIINHTAHKVFLFGFTNWVWNGASTALQTDKGLIVEKGGLIGAKHGGNLLLFNTLPNGLAQDWREGLAPPAVTFTYVSPGDTNGVIYYLGAIKYNESFVNPNTRGEIIATASSSIDGNRQPPKAFDRTNSATIGCWRATITSYGWLQINFIDKLFKCNRFELWATSSHPLSTHLGPDCKFQGSNDGSNWVDILTFYPNVGSNERWNSGGFLNSEFYQYYRISSFINNYHTIGDLEMYGDLLL